MDIGEAIRAEIRALLRSRGHLDPQVSASDALTATLGLSSFDVLALVPRLNATLGVDPFRGTLAITDVRTVGDLVQAYEDTRAPIASGPVAAGPLHASATRAALRRLRGGG
jgi:acyl carrier protein